ncbi:MAG: hypothetical protein JSU95_05645 [Betaproteobacteria bacterium]|nr:MAG: hypothetical protein JSU95_05645 [Betaproteobacteria bacterium]
MLTRSAILMIATLFALSASVAVAKVSPALETQGQFGDQMLQQLINKPQANESCEIAQMKDFEAAGGRDSIGPDSIGTVALGATLTSKLDDACPIPAPSPDPFENVAYL